MHYRIRASRVPEFLRYLGLNEPNRVQAHGEVRELGNITPYPLELSSYGFRSLYSVYPEWPIAGVTNYQGPACARFCELVDVPDSGVLVSVGRRHCAFRCKAGGCTRTLAGNQFDVYCTKTRRSLRVSFDRYADEDPPVREFSGGVRSRLAQLGMKI